LIFFEKNPKKKSDQNERSQATSMDLTLLKTEKSTPTKINLFINKNIVSEHILNLTLAQFFHDFISRQVVN